MPSAETFARTTDISGWFTPWRFGVLLAVAIGAVFPGVLLGADTFFYRDFGVLAYPSIFYHRECFWRGELPLWNPLSNCGSPFLAQWGTMVLYPFSLFYLLLPLPWSLNLFCLGHLSLGGMGAYWLASGWTGNRFAGSVAGTGYVFSGAMFSCLLWPNYAVVLGWMPWVVWSAEQGWRKGGRWTVLAGIISAMQVLAGVPEVAILTWLLILGLFLVEAMDGKIDRYSAIKRLGGVVLMVAGLTAIQILPFLDLIQHSQRDRSFATAKWSMPLSGLANFLVPLFHNFRTPQGIYFQVGQQFLSSTYLGVGTLALAACAPLTIRQKRAWLLSLLVLISIVFALGDNGPVYRGIKSVFPLMGFARYPIKFLLLAAFLVPLLAALAVAKILELRPGGSGRRGARSLLAVGCAGLLGIGVVLTSAWRNPFPSDQWQVILTSGLSRAFVLMLILALTAALRTRMASLSAGAVLILLVLDALSHAPRQNPTLPSRVLAPGLWEAVHHFPPPKGGESRVMISPSAEESLLKSGVTDFETDLLGKRLAGWSHLNLLEGVAKVNGSSTLQIREQAQVQSLLYGATNQSLPQLLDFLAVSHISSESNAVAWTGRTTQLPLISIGKRPLFMGAETLRFLTNAAFDPRLVICLPTEAEREITAAEVAGAKVISETFNAKRVFCEVESPAPAILSVAQSFYPFWRATVDDRPVKLWRANHAFQAIEVPAGRHRVEFRYADPSFQLGCAVSIGTLLFSGFFWRRSRRKEESRGLPENKSSPDA